MGIQPRAYSPKDLPCYPPDDNWLDSNVLASETRSGLFFVESSKTDATTGLSITLRIAKSLAQTKTSSNQNEVCKIRFNHKKASQMNYAGRSKSRSFLWSLVRDPTQRALLEFFHYQVAWRQVEPTVSNISKFFQQSKRQNRQLKTLTLSKHGKVEKGMEEEAIHTILKEYDFLGVTERMEESAVALMMLLDLSISDVMYIPM